jgi:hypothetical protein
MIGIETVFSFIMTHNSLSVLSFALPLSLLFLIEFLFISYTLKEPQFLLRISNNCFVCVKTLSWALIFVKSEKRIKSTEVMIYILLFIPVVIKPFVD